MREALKDLVPRRSRRAVAMWRVRTRASTGSVRAVPDFLIIGAQRCGTSSLYRYLSQHPCVMPSVRKEVEYFSRYYHLGSAWYRAHFPLEARRWVEERIRGNRVLTFEATPDYLLHPQAAGRAAATVPEARLIVLLRNPIDRALSHHQHMVQLGFETLPLEEALEAESSRLEAAASDGSRSYFRYSYKTRGRYAEQLERWMALFPRDRFLVVRSEDLYAAPAPTYREILRFLSLPSWNPREFRNHSSRTSPTQKVTPMESSTRRELAEYFAPHNDRLAELLGWETGWS